MILVRAQLLLHGIQSLSPRLTCAINDLSWPRARCPSNLPTGTNHEHDHMHTSVEVEHAILRITPPLGMQSQPMDYWDHNRHTQPHTCPASTHMTILPSIHTQSHRCCSPRTSDMSGIGPRISRWVTTSNSITTVGYGTSCSRKQAKSLVHTVPLPRCPLRMGVQPEGPVLRTGLLEELIESIVWAHSKYV